MAARVDPAVDTSGRGNLFSGHRRQGRRTARPSGHDGRPLPARSPPGPPRPPSRPPPCRRPPSRSGEESADRGSGGECAYLRRCPCPPVHSRATPRTMHRQCTSPAEPVHPQMHPQCTCRRCRRSLTVLGRVLGRQQTRHHSRHRPVTDPSPAGRGRHHARVPVQAVVTGLPCGNRRGDGCDGSPGTPSHPSPEPPIRADTRRMARSDSVTCRCTT